MKRIYLLLVFCCLGIVARAQTDAIGYRWSQSNGSYTALSGASTAIATGWNDNNSSAISLGFNFVFMGTTYTQVVINSNGYLVLGSTGPTATVTTPMSGTQPATGVISAMGMNLQEASSGGQPILCLTTGSSGSRVFTAQWTACRFSASALAESWTFQIKLYESSNIIQIVYGSNSTGTTNRTCQVGIRGIASADINNRTTTTGWDVSTQGTGNTSTMALRAAINPASGLTYTWCPNAALPSVTLSATTGCAGTAVTASGASTYSWSPATNLSATTGATVTATPTVTTTEYIVTGTASNGCANFAAYTSLVPVFSSVAAPATICLGASTTITGSADSSRYSVSSIAYSNFDTTSFTAGPTGDDAFSTVTIPFTFNYFGVNYTSINISTNGYANFGTATTAGYTTGVTMPSASLASGAIGAFLHDMSNTSLTGGTITYGVTGSTPNRKFIMSWVNYGDFGVTTSTIKHTGKIILYETTNVIEIHVTSSSGARTSGGGIRPKFCGIQNIGGTSAFVAPGRNGEPFSVTTPEAWRFTPYLSTRTNSPTYAWAPASTLTSTTGLSSVATPTVSGTVTYSITTTDPVNGCSFVSTRAVTVNPLPTVSVAPTNGCYGINMVASGTGNTYAWTPATGLSATTGATVNPTPGSATTYTVTSTITATGCTNTATKLVNLLPTIGVTPTSANFCTVPGTAVALTASTSGGTTTYSWSPASTLDAATGVSVNSTPTATTTTYTVTGTEVSTGCSNTATSVITKLITPGGIVPFVPSDTVVCYPGYALMTETGTGGSWSTSDPSVATVDAGGSVYTSGGTGGVTIYYTSPCGTDSLRIRVASGGFTLSVTPSSATYCSSGSPVTLTASASGGTADLWLWTDIGGGAPIGLSSTSTPATDASPTVTATYAVFGTNSSTGCHAVTTVTVTNNTPPAITGTNTVCMGSTRTYVNSGGAGTWSSSDAGVATVNPSTGVITPVSPSTATITYTVTASGCSVTRGITVNALPTLSFTPSSAYACGGIGVAVTASGASTYTWAAATGLSATTGATVTANPGSTTTYTITGTDVNGCVNTGTKTVNFGANYVAAFLSPAADTVCPGGTDVLTGQAAASATSYTVTSITYAPPTLATTSTITTGDDVVTTFGMPFTFNFFGANFSSVNLTTNGFLNFGATSTLHSSGITIPNATSVALNSINAFYSDISVGGTGFGEVDTLGTAPNRRYVFHTINGPCCSGGNTFEGWIVLYEGSNIVDVHVNRTESRTQICGIQNGTGSIGFTPSGRNGVTYQVTTPEAWRFTPSFPSLTYTWATSGTLSATTGTPVTATVTGATTYTVTATDPSTGCNGSYSKTIQNYINPTVTIAPSTVCVGTPMTASGAVTYTWSPSTGLASTTGATVTPTSYTAITYTATGTDARGCIGTATKPLSFPTVNITPSSAIFCSAGAAVGLTASGTSVSYSWSPAAGLSATTGASVNASPTVTTTYTVIGTDASGCAGPANSTITYNVTPSTITAPGGSTTICLPGTLVLSTDGTGGNWSSSATGVATVDPTGVVTGVSAGSATITYENTTCGFATYNINVVPGGFTVSTTPGSGTYCASGSPLSITASDGGAGATFTWAPATGLSATTGATIAASPAATTSYTVTGTVSGCANSAVVVVTNNTPAAISGASSVCTGLTTSYTNATGGGTWSSSASGVASVDASTGLVYGVSAGTADITYTVTATGCFVTRSITVNTTPTLSFTPASAQACGGIGVAVTASGASTYSWTPAAGLSATTGATVTANPTSSTTYSITGVSAAGCSVVATKFVGYSATLITAYALSSPSNVCPGGTTTLTAGISSSSTTYSVSSITYAPPTLTGTTTGPTGDDNFSTTTIPFTFNFYGTNYTSLNVTTNGFLNFGTGTTLHSSGITIPNTTAVGLASINAFYSDISVGGTGSCEYVTTGTAPNRKFTFHTINGPCCSGGNTFEGWIILYETSNIIDVLVNRTENRTQICGIQNATGTVGVTPSGRNGVTYQVTTPEAWRFAPSFPTATYAWTPVTGVTSTTATSTTATVASTTVYTVTATDPASGCNGSFTTTVNAYTAPTVTIAPSVVCSGTPMTASGASTYTWSPASGLSSTAAATVTPTPTVVTTYTVSGTDTNGCVGTATKTISFPTVSLSPTSALYCSSGSPVSITASGTGVSYSWSPSAGLSATTGTSVSASPTASTVYTVTATDASGCTNTALDTITYNIATAGISGPSSTLCLPGTMVLTQTGTGGTWSSSDTTISLVNSSGLVTGVTTGATTITYNNPACGGFATYSLNNVSGGFTISVTPSSGTYCSTGSALNATASGGTTYVWLPSAGLDVTTGATVNASPTVTTVYTVTGTTSGCSNSATLTVTNNTPAPITGGVTTLCSAVSGALSTTSTTWTDATGGGTWSSSAPGVATVSTGGVVTGVSAGTATITYDVSGCYVTRNITVNASPALTFTPTSAAACGGGSVVVTASGAASYSWTPASGLSSTVSASPTVTPTITTTYTITGTSALGCASVATKLVGFSGTAMLAYASSTPTQVCTGGVTTLTGQVASSATSYTVSSITYSAPTLSTTSAGPTGDDAFSTTVMPFTFNFFGSNFTSVNLTTNGFLNFGTGTTIHTTGTSIPNPTTIGLNSINAFYSDLFIGSPGLTEFDTLGTAPNRKFVFHTIAAPCCSGGNSFEGWILLYEGSNIIDVLVDRAASRGSVCGIQNSTGTIGFAPSGRSGVTYAVTTPEAWRFTPVFPSATYAWTPTSGVTSSASATTTATVTATTTYTVTVTDPATGCSGTYTTTDTAVAQPTVTVTTAYTNFCSGGQDSLVATPSGGVGPITSYTWSGPGISSTTSAAASASFNPTVAATTSGTYTVSVAYAGSGCNPAVNTTASVTIEPDPTVTVSPSVTSLCPGDNLILTESLVSGGVGTPTYSWSGPGITTTTGSSSTSPTFTPTVSSGAYSVAVTYSGRGCDVANANTGTVTVNANPIAYAMTGGSTGCTGTGLTLGLANSQTGVSYQLRLGGTPTGSPVSGTTGSPVSFGLQTAAGTYDVLATGPGSCTTVMTGSAVITTSPIAYNITGGSACSSVGITVGVSNSQSGVTYQANRSGSGVGSTASGTGSAITSISTQTTAGVYTVVGTDGVGCATTMNGTDTVYQTPSITLGSSPSVCLPATTASLSYTSAVGSPTHYSIVWDAAAITAGYSNVTGASLPASPISLSLSSTPGTYSGTLTVTNGSCTSTNYSFSVTVYAIPTAAITSATAPCVGYSTNVVFTGTSGASVTYTVDGGSSATGLMTGGTFTLSTGAITSSHIYRLLNAFNPVCSTTLSDSVTVNPIAMAWNGSTSTDWNTAANWSCGFVPGASDDVTIPSGTTFAPDIAASASGTTRNLTIASGAVVTVNSSANLNVKGALNNSSSVVGAGRLRMNGSSAQTISGFGTVNNFESDNSAGVTINTGARLTVKGTVYITAGALNTSDSMVLYSDSVATARVDAITGGGSIVGQAKVMVYIPGGRRVYRFWSHPFSNYIGLSQVQNYIDVTGPGGAANGFTGTATNSPSAFRYNPLVGNSSLPSDPGWRSFGSTSTTLDSNRLKQYMGIRLFFRGAKGTGLGTTPYTPAAVTVAQWGSLNQGNQTVTLSKGSSNPYQEYNMVGNPYPSPVDIGTVVYNALVAGNVVGPSYFVWNPSLGSAGQFQAQFISTTSATPYYLQACNAFQVRAAANGRTLSFTESHKGTSPTTNLFKAAPEYVSLKVYDANYHPYDMAYIRFNDAATDADDYTLDAPKPFGGADFNFYSLSSDNHKMIIDARPYDAEKVIPLGVDAANHQDYIIKAEGITVPEGGELYLHDKLLKQYVALQVGTEYRFSVTDDAATQGDNRFELSMKPAAAMASNKGLQVTLTPNPTTDDVKIAFTAGKKENVSIRIMDLSGVSVYNTNLGEQVSGTVNVQMSNFASGIYMVELTSGSQKVVQRLVKE